MSDLDFKLDPKSTAVVVIDLQKGITGLPVSPLPIETVIANSVRLLATARQTGAQLSWFTSADRPMVQTACIRQLTSLRASLRYRPAGAISFLN